MAPVMTTKRLHPARKKKMVHDGYLHDPNEQNSENGYLVKLHGSIMESEFRGTRIRLRWYKCFPGLLHSVPLLNNFDYITRTHFWF